VKDLLRVKGVNVSPAEVEGVLMQHPTIDLAYVVGLPPDGSDQELVAIVVPRGGNWEEAAWRAWCNAQLSSYKRPSRYLRARADELPYGPTSKPSRAELARLAQRKLEEPA
jgi:fatty-acyl-CoA synthase